MNILLREDITIAASVSCFNLFNIESQLRPLEEAGVKLLHFDVVDGRFNDCFTLGTPTLEAIRPHTSLPIEVHLAVWEPGKYIDQFISAGADYIAVHYEAIRNSEPARGVLSDIRKKGAGPVLALRAETECNDGLLSLFSKVDWVLKLLVNPGYSGQPMRPAAVASLRDVGVVVGSHGLQVGIEADGNINPRTIPSVVEAGANILTGGTSGLFTPGGNIASNVQAMLNAARNGFRSK